MNKVLSQYFNEKALLLAFERIKRWPNRAVKDTIGIKAFQLNIKENITSLHTTLIAGNYQASKPFQYYAPKSSGTQRTQALLMAQDAIVYQAIANKIAERAYPSLKENEAFVFGSVLSNELSKGESILDDNDASLFFFKFWKDLFGRFADSVVKAVKEDKVAFKLETDITGFFDSIPHYNLLETLMDDFGVEPEILDILGEALNTWCGTKDGCTPGVGIPQGPLPSFFLANCLLHTLDKKMIDEGYKYYRYMDDMKIYGYEEHDLRKALVRIDQYLKSHGLSINSKKTSIEAVTEEDATAKELQNVVANFNYEDEDEETITSQVKEIEKLVDKDHHNYEGSSSDSHTLTDPQEIREFWIEQMNEVERDLPLMVVKSDKGYALAKDSLIDRDFIKLSVQYGTALRELNATVMPKDDLLPLWIYLFDKFFWRANNFWLTLRYYKNNEILKKHLLASVKKENLYEWHRYYEYFLLSVTQEFTDKEMRSLFNLLKDEKNDYPKVTLYKLLVRHCSDDQLLRSVKNLLAKEKNEYLRLMIVTFLQINKSTDITIDESFEIYGI